DAARLRIREREDRPGEDDPLQSLARLFPIARTPLPRLSTQLSLARIDVGCASSRDVLQLAAASYPPKPAFANWCASLVERAPSCCRLTPAPFAPARRVGNTT